jgi:hypothetical protein
MCFSRPNVPDPAEETRRAEEERVARVRETTNQVNSVFDQRFGPNYYSGLGDAYRQYYAPQIEDQFTKAQRATALRYADNADSSAANRTTANLFGDKLRAQQDLESGVSDVQNNARREVEDKRGNLISLAEAGQSQEGTAAMARAAANSGLGRPTYSPMGDLFSRYTGELTRTAAAQNQGYAGNPLLSRQVDFLRGNRSGSQRIVGG